MNSMLGGLAEHEQDHQQEKTANGQNLEELLRRRLLQAANRGLGYFSVFVP